MIVQLSPVPGIKQSKSGGKGQAQTRQLPGGCPSQSTKFKRGHRCDIAWSGPRTHDSARGLTGPAAVDDKSAVLPTHWSFTEHRMVAARFEEGARSASWEQHSLETLGQEVVSLR